MAIHDWRKVDSSVFHAFHTTWIGGLQTALNDGLLPDPYYALCEQPAGDTVPDVLTLQEVLQNEDADTGRSNGGVATLIQKPPKVRLVQSSDHEFFTRKRRSLMIRHSSDDRLVAIIEIISPGNKASASEFRRFLDKAISVLNQGIHLLIVDLFPPTKRDPEGIHGAIWAECGEAYEQPADKRLTLVSYCVGENKTAYVEPLAVGDALTAMPLFLDPTSYVDTPLESTYQAAFVGVPRRHRKLLEAS